MQERKLIDYWDHLLAADPEAIALICPNGEELTRCDVEQRAARVAEALKSADVRRRSILLICVPNGLEWMAAFLACLRSGIVVVSADHGLSENDLERIAESIGAAALWNGVDTRRVAGERWKRFRDPEIVLGKLTSGSTGLPNCLYFKNGEMIADGRLTMEAFGYRSTDTNFGVIPWGHSYGLGAIVVPFLLLGYRITWLLSPLPADIERALAQRRPTVFPSVPTLLKALLKSDCRPEAFASIRVLMTAGSRLDPGIAQAFKTKYRIAPRNLYGSSETGSICYDPTGDDTASGASVGRVLPGVSVGRARDGRLRVSGPAVCTHGNRSRDVASNGVCTVGDFGELDAANRISLSSRAKGFVKIGEKRVGLNDVERRLEALPEVTACHAFGALREGEIVLAAAVQSNSSRKEIARSMRAAIPSRYRPAVWVHLQEFPMTARGKIDSLAIQQSLTERMARE